MKPRLTRQTMIEIVSDTLPQSYVDDLPAIRQAVNDTADSYRKDGYSVSDFAQASIVRAIQNRMNHKMSKAPLYGCRA